MVTGYSDNTQNISLEDIRRILKVISDIISKPPKYIINKLKSKSANDFGIEFQQRNDVLTNEQNQNSSKNIELYNTMDSLASSLKKNGVFYDEYFDFCEIQDMIKDTLNRDSSLIKDEDLEFILELVVNFSDLINYKIDLIENNEYDENTYESKYNSYLTDFNKSQIYFYKNVCDETLDDDLFIEYTNIIME